MGQGDCNEPMWDRGTGNEPMWDRGTGNEPICGTNIHLVYIGKEESVGGFAGRQDVEVCETSQSRGGERGGKGRVLEGWKIGGTVR